MMIFVIFTTCLHCNKGFALTLEVMAEVFSTPSYFVSDKIYGIWFIFIYLYWGYQAIKF